MTEAAAAPVRVVLTDHVGNEFAGRTSYHLLKLGRAQPGSKGGLGGLLPSDKVLVSFAKVLIIGNIRPLSLTRKCLGPVHRLWSFLPHTTPFFQDLSAPPRKYWPSPIQSRAKAPPVSLLGPGT